MIDDFASAFSMLLLNAVLPSVAALFAVFAAVFACRVAANASRRIRRAGGVSVCIGLGLWIFAMTESGSPPTREEKEQMRAVQLVVDAERVAIGEILVGQTVEVTSSVAETGETMPISRKYDDNSTSQFKHETPTITDFGSFVSSGEITADEYAAGFALVRVGTGETFDFSPPANAIICEEWRRFGAASDRQRIVLYDEANDGYAGFPFGTKVIQRLTVFSDGEARVATTNAATTIAPLKCVSSFLPASFWWWCDNSSSQFWSQLTPSNSFVMTWQNIVFRRLCNCPTSFQAELFENGDMEFRYDLSHLGGTIVSNVIVGAINNGIGRLFSEIPVATTSLRFARLDPTRADEPDPDGDGIATIDELFVYGTNPYESDSDRDGLSDGAEINETNTDPNNAYSAGGVYNDGLSVALGGVDPFECPEGSTNSVLEHLFYSGTTNGVFAYPMPTDEVGVLEIMVSGSGTGHMVVGDAVVPLVGIQTTGFTGLRGEDNPVNPVSPVTNTLLLAVGKGERKELWWEKPEGLDVAIRSDDLIIGELPSPLWWKGWIAFPHTDATIPCIHDLNTKQKAVTLVHGEEFPGLMATWSSESEDVWIADNPPVSAEITGRFPRTASRILSYEVSHPKRLNESPVVFTQEAQYCPRISLSDAAASGVVDEDIEPQDGWCQCYGGWWCWCDGRCGGACPCCESMSNDPTSESESAAEYARVTSLPEAPGVLQLFGLRGREDAVQLHVPSGEPVRCCECPDHWQSNHVTLAWHSSRLEVRDATDEDFCDAYEDTSVRVRGVGPSYAVGKDSILFTTNGVPSKCRRYTVLGMDICSTTGVSMDTYNALNPSFGYPVTICTNFSKAVDLQLDANVMLPNGVFRLALENIDGRFELWLPDRWKWDAQRGHEVHLPASKLLDSESMPERYFTVRQWRKLLVDRLCDSRTLSVQVLAPVVGHFDLIFSFACEADARSIKSSACQRISSVKPPLLPDYNRDGRVDERDAYDWSGGRIHYFWTNHDTWRGDDAFSSYSEGCHALPLTLPDNSGDLVVNGRNDLVNLCPFAVDLSRFAEAWGTSRIRYEFRTGSPGRVRFVPVRTKWDTIDDIVKKDQKTYSDVYLHVSPLLVTSGSSSREVAYRIPQELVWSGASGEGVIAAEFTMSHLHELKLVVLPSIGNYPLFAISVPIMVLDVHDMYRWLNLDYACNETTDPKYNDKLSVAWPDGEHADANVVFVHGYNVHPSEAWDWSQAMFKRLWWSGMDAGFTAVLWRGNESQVWVPKVPLVNEANGYATRNYHQNVLNAFRTASAFSSRVNSLPGAKKFMIAHSLGNMLVSAARQDYGLQYEQYFMLNAAVAVEAYDPVEGVTTNSYYDMTPKEWRQYPDRVRSTHWYELFLSNPNDERGKLTWKGRFKDVDNTINFYSSRDEVVANGGDKVDKLLSREFAWYNQEQAKGSILVSFNPQAGWGFGNHYINEVQEEGLNGETYYSYPKFTPEEALLIAATNLMVRPFFKDFRDAQIYGDGGSAFLLANDMVRWYALSHGIPAESYAAGANPVPKWGEPVAGNILNQQDYGKGLIRNVNMARNCVPDHNEGEVNENEKELPWVHSYFIQNSLFDTSVLYEALVEQIGSTKPKEVK